jgi:hypothetical protein
MDEKPRRRWLRFSVRTLLVAVTIFCVWLGWNYRIVAERKALIELVIASDGIVREQSESDNPFDAWEPPAPPPPVPLIREWMGDSGVAYFYNLDKLSKADIARLRVAFPESHLIGTTYTYP